MAMIRLIFRVQLPPLNEQCQEVIPHQGSLGLKLAISALTLTMTYLEPPFLCTVNAGKSCMFCFFGISTFEVDGKT